MAVGVIRRLVVKLVHRGCDTPGIVIICLSLSDQITQYCVMGVPFPLFGLTGGVAGHPVKVAFDPARAPFVKKSLLVRIQIFASLISKIVYLLLILGESGFGVFALELHVVLGDRP